MGALVAAGAIAGTSIGGTVEVQDGQRGVQHAIPDGGEHGDGGMCTVGRRGGQHCQDAAGHLLASQRFITSALPVPSNAVWAHDPPGWRRVGYWGSGPGIELACRLQSRSHSISAGCRQRTQHRNGTHRRNHGSAGTGTAAPRPWGRGTRAACRCGGCRTPGGAPGAQAPEREVGGRWQQTQSVQQ